MESRLILKAFVQLLCEDFDAHVLEVHNLVRRMSASEIHVRVCVEDIVRVIQAFSDRRLSSDQLVMWAEMIEGADWVEYEAGRESRIAQALFELSTPEINEVLTIESVRSIRSQLLSDCQ